MGKAPCKDCPNRTIEPNCHNPEICEKWAQYQIEHRAEREKVYKARLKFGSDSEFVRQQVRTMYKEKRRGGKK